MRTSFLIAVACVVSLPAGAKLTIQQIRTASDDVGWPGMADPYTGK